MENLRIYAVDVGSVGKGHFGWARKPSKDINPTKFSEIQTLADFLSKDLSKGLPVALGFEAPLFIPIPHNCEELGKRREMDPSDRAWSANAGACVLAAVSAQMPWILREVSRKVSTPFTCFLSWDKFKAKKEGLFIWEAIVTKEAKGKDHIDDAFIAIRAFKKFLSCPSNFQQGKNSSFLNLAACALLLSGLSRKISLIKESCLVVEAIPDNE